MAINLSNIVHSLLNTHEQILKCIKGISNILNCNRKPNHIV